MSTTQNRPWFLHNDWLVVYAVIGAICYGVHLFQLEQLKPHNVAYQAIKDKCYSEGGTITINMQNGLQLCVYPANFRKL